MDIFKIKKDTRLISVEYLLYKLCILIKFKRDHKINQIVLPTISMSTQNPKIILRELDREKNRRKPIPPGIAGSKVSVGDWQKDNQLVLNHPVFCEQSGSCQDRD